jgi:peptidoglycan/LPS O-acetylase OafA/YrhL
MTTRRARIEPSFSLYLDFVRFVAAVLVVLEHVRQWGVVNDWQARLLPSSGRESVIVFFVLSGFVIAYSTGSKNISIGEYFAARMTRIYSVALPVLLLSFGIAGFLSHLFDRSIVHFYQLDNATVYVPFHLLFLGEFWNMAETPPLLAPYWSLSHEVWYYILFGLACYLRGPARLVVCTCVVAAMGPKLWLLLPVWGSGVLLFHWLERHIIPQRTARIGWLASIVLLIAYNASGLEDHLRPIVRSLWPFVQIKLGSGERVLTDYLVCALVLVNFACARFAGFSGLQRFAAPIRSLAFFTFSLYLAHPLVLGTWRSLHRHDAGEFSLLLSMALLIATSTWALGHVAEFLRLRTLASIGALKRRRARTGWKTVIAGQLARIREFGVEDPLPPKDTDTIRRAPAASPTKRDRK